MNEFSSDAKHHSKIWESIASDMNKVDSEIAVSGIQCQTKMNSMKEMYRKIIDHNSISRNDRKSWQYFEVYYIHNACSSQVLFFYIQIHLCNFDIIFLFLENV